jgi:hypothetical protein
MDAAHGERHAERGLGRADNRLNVQTWQSIFPEIWINEYG